MNNENKININWYPGHMEKTKRELKKISPIIDFVVELIDSRIPYSSKMVGIEDLIKNKPHILVMTKKDLCDIDETSKWVKYYENLGLKVVLADLNDPSNIEKIVNEINKISLMVNSKRQEKGLKSKQLKGLIIGIPNVGKSTLINRLAKKKVAGVGNIPGFTKSLTWIKTGDTLLLDSPGILWPKFESEEVALNLASMSAIKIEILDESDIALHILNKLNCYYQDILKNRFGIESLSEDCEKNYQMIGNKIGALEKGGTIDYRKVNLYIVNDIRQENIKGITFDRYKL